MTRPPIRIASGLALGLALLAGCSGEQADDATTPSAQQSAQPTAGTPAAGTPSTGVTIEVDEGTIAIGSDKLPEGYPADKVPVVDGVITSTGAIGTGFAVVVTSDASIRQAAALTSVFHDGPEVAGWR
ncbi:MAG: hypothetical protein WBB91_13065 [Nostocoides sp.]|uniref:hypothetical protein n=2 Tax=Nostocoides sp. TaxID=1917966 RepID=UPI003C782754